MIYQSRKRKYKSRQERYEGSLRLLRVLLLFGTLAGVVWVFFRRQLLYDWVRTYFN
ncbi:MAG: hypothetical protein H6577_16770 [Lewinellaceae bacterium]|nr:hypothetical protein [Saprospiraceae bacterium]MCB9339779.1 hypothetical protein [Lewinellaceae bacterium]